MTHYFSDIQIEHILEIAEAAYRHNKLSKGMKQTFLLTLQEYLKTNGTIENVCPSCLGTGKRNASSL